VKFGDPDSMKKFMEVNRIEVTGNNEPANESKLPARLLSDNHILFEKTR